VVVLEAGHDDDVSGDLSRTKSLTDENLDSWRDVFIWELGFGFRELQKYATHSQH
jgi:hypothetical protein